MQKIEVKYFGTDIDAVLEKLVTTQIILEYQGGYIIRAEVFEKEIDMWLRSQGDLVNIIK